MPDSSSLNAQKLVEFATQGDSEAFEALWLETLDQSPGDFPALMAGVEALESRGDRSKAALYLSMLVPTLLERDQASLALLALHKLVATSPREAGLREQILATYRKVHGHRPELDIYIARSGIEEKGVPVKEALARLKSCLSFQPGAYIHHPAGWGTGRVAAVDPEDASVVIDFEGKPGHRMAMEMAARITESVDPDDLRALKLDRRPDLVRMLKEDRPAVIRAALRSRRGKASQRDLRNAITNGILDAKAWSRWWPKARQDIKNVPDISITPGNNPTIELVSRPAGFPDSCVKDLRSLGKTSQRIKYVRDLIKEAQAHEDGQQALKRSIAFLAGPGRDGAALEPGCRISLCFLIQEAAASFEELDVPPDMAPEKVVSDHHEVVLHLPEIPIAAHRIMALKVLRQSGDRNWPDLFRQVMLRGEPETAEYCLVGLVENGKTEDAKAAITTIVNHYREHPMAFVWFLKASLARRLPASVSTLSMHALLEKTVILHNHLAVARQEGMKGHEAVKVARQIAQVLAARKNAFIREAFESSGQAEGLNLCVLLRNNRSLREDLRDKIMATMYRARPELARPAPGPKTRDEQATTRSLSDSLYTTAEALLAKRQEYEHLVNVRIPENAAQIGRAASYGDLSENAEWTAAVEKQGQLSLLAKEMGAELERARVIGPDMQDGVHVSLGSRVFLEEPRLGSVSYAILGPWDADTSKGTISYLSPVGTALLGAKVGDTVRIEVPSGILEYKVARLESALPVATDITTR